MKKIIFIIATFMIVFAAQSCFAADFAVFDGFENSIGDALSYYTDGRTTLTHSSDGVNGSDGCVEITTDSAFGFKYPVSFVPGTTYKISFWVKYTNTKPNQLTILGATSGSKPVDTGYMAEKKYYSFADGTSFGNMEIDEWYPIEYTYTAVNTEIEDKYVGVRLFSSSQSLSDEVVYIDEISVEPVTATEGSPVVTDVTVNEPVFTETEVKWSYTGNGSSNKLVVIADRGDGEFIAYSGDAKSGTFIPEASLKGATLKFKVIPSSDSNVGVGYVYTLENPVAAAFEVTKSIIGTIDDATIKANVNVVSGNMKKDVVVMLCFYDAENTMIAMHEASQAFDIGDEDHIEVEADVPDEAVDYQLFIWEGLSSLGTTLNVLN